MNWIKEVRLENFQSHLDTFITFTNGLNVIVGQSDSGKTAILRGIRWVLFNQPRGTDFMRVSGDFVRVTITFANECRIVRERTTSKNRYIIKAPGKEEVVLEGFGIHVPQEVLDAHQIYPLRIDRDMELLLNVSQQLDGPFLLEQTASVRAKTIGRISGAHYIDMAVRDTTKDVAKLQQQTRHVETEVEGLNKKLSPYQFLDKAKEQLDRSEQKFHRLKEKEANHSRLELLKVQLQELAAGKEKVEKELTILEGVNEWERDLERLQYFDEKKRSFQIKYNQMGEINKAMNACKHWIKKTNNVDEAKKSTTLIAQKHKSVNQLKQLNETYKRLNHSLVDVKTTIHNTLFATYSEEQKVQELLHKVRLVNELRHLQHHYKLVSQQVRTLKKTIDRLLLTQKCEERHGELNSHLYRLETYKNIKEKLVDVNKRLKDGAVFISGKQKEEQQLRQKYEQQLLEKGNCPTCGGQLSSATIKQLLT